VDLPPGRKTSRSLPNIPVISCPAGMSLTTVCVVYCAGSSFVKFKMDSQQVTEETNVSLFVTARWWAAQ